jgi:hypothetical protein
MGTPLSALVAMRVLAVPTLRKIIRCKANFDFLVRHPP